MNYNFNNRITRAFIFIIWHLFRAIFPFSVLFLELLLLFVFFKTIVYLLKRIIKERQILKTIHRSKEKCKFVLFQQMLQCTVLPTLGPFSWKQFSLLHALQVAVVYFSLLQSRCMLSCKHRNFPGQKLFHSSITGVAKLLGSSSHFSKIEIFCEPQLNTQLKGTQKRYLKKYTIYIYWKHINKSTKFVFWIYKGLLKIKYIYFTSLDNSLKVGE